MRTDGRNIGLHEFPHQPLHFCIVEWCIDFYCSVTGYGRCNFLFQGVDVHDLSFAIKSIEQLEFTGSYRRGKETVGDLDILVVAATPAEAMDLLAAYPEVSLLVVNGTGDAIGLRLDGRAKILDDRSMRRAYRNLPQPVHD